MAKVFKTLEEALEAQTKQKKEVEKVKKELTTYFTKNKLKRNEDYTDDPEHGPKIQKLEKEIDKKEETMAKVNQQVKDLEKGKKGKGKVKAAKETKETKGKVKAEKAAKGEGRTTKYEYPEDCDTPQKKKVYRVAARAAEKNGKPAPGSYKEVMEAKAEKAAKKEAKPAKEAKEAKPAKEAKVEKTTKSKKEDKATSKKKPSKKKEEPAKEAKEAKKKKSKKVEDD